MELLLKLLEGLVRWVGWRWVRKWALLRIYRAAARKACAEFELNPGSIMSIFNDPGLQDILLRERYSEDDERAALEGCLKRLNVVPGDTLGPFVRRLSDLALDGMEDSLLWRGRAQERTKERGKRKEEVPQLPELPPRKAPLYIGVFCNPPVPKGFVNRQPELDELMSWLTDEEDSLFFIGGPAGRGKSYVASKFYSQVQESGGWEARWIDCSSEPRLTLDVLLGTFAREFSEELEGQSIEMDTSIKRIQDYLDRVENPQLQYPVRMDSLIQLLRRKKWLIVLENYHEVEDKGMDEFLKRIVERSTEIKVLVVGRERPAVFDNITLPTGAYRECRLAPLPEEEAQSYLSELGLPVEQGMARRIWNKCAGEPLAMKIFVNTARRRGMDALLEMALPEWSQNSTEWLNQLTAALSEEELQAARVLSVFPEPVERLLLNYVCQLPEAVDALEYHFLLDRDESHRLSLHPILRDYWSAQLGEAGRELHVRAAEWLEETARKDGRVWRSDYLRRAFFHWKAAGENEKALQCAEELWDLADDKWHLSVQALALARQVQDLKQIGNWLYRLGTLQEEAGAYGDAEQCYRESLEIAQQHGDMPLQAQVLSALGRLDRLWRRYADAEGKFKESLTLARSLGDEEGGTSALRELGLLRMEEGMEARAQGNFPQAERCFAEVLDIAAQVFDSELRRKALTQMGYLRDTQGDWALAAGELSEAERLYQEALDIANMISHTSLRDQVRLHIGYLRAAEGEAAQKQGEYEQAEQRYRESLEIARELGNVSLQVQAHAYLGLLYAVKCHPEQASQQLIQALDLWERLEEVPRAMRWTDEVVKADELLGAESKHYLGMLRKRVWESQESQAAKKDASQLLTEAAEIFERLGDERARQVRAELEQLEQEFSATGR